MPTEAVHVALEEKIMMTVRTTTDIGLSGPYFFLPHVMMMKPHRWEEMVACKGSKFLVSLH